ncbi:MAG: GNAT family N-acetyltransferase [Polyangiaceae bacterium]
MTVLHTARLALRPLRPEDFDSVCAQAADARVMTPLGGVRSAAQVRAWLDRELSQLASFGYCRNVVTHEGELVGLVGLTRADFDVGVVPAIEIAWQLAHAHWGRGFATEAARSVLDDAFTTHGLTELIAVTSINNQPSRRVMERLGMRHSPHETFEHPRLAEGDPLRTHVVYRAALPPSQ